MTKEVSLGVIETVVDGKANFELSGGLPGMEYLPVEGYEVPEMSGDYAALIRDCMQLRLDYLKAFNDAKSRTSNSNRWHLKVSRQSTLHRRIIVKECSVMTRKIGITDNLLGRPSIFDGNPYAN